MWLLHYIAVPALGATCGCLRQSEQPGVSGGVELPAMSHAALVVDGLDCRYGEFDALRDFNRRASFVALHKHSHGR